MACNNTNVGNENFQCEDAQNWQTVENIAFNFQTYYLWIVFALGFPGNCGTIITVIKMSPARSLTVYIALLAVVDNLSIVNKLLMFILPDNKVDIGSFGCKTLGYFGNFLITFANWLLVGMSVERCAAVWFPFKVGQTWTFKKSLIAVALLAVPLLMLFIPLFWIVTSVLENGNFYCDIYEEYQYFVAHVWFWINVVVYAVLPCVLLLIFNLIIVAGIVKSAKQQAKLKCRKGNRGVTSPVDRNRQVTVMLLASALTLLVLTFPRCVMLILSAYWKPKEKSMESAVKDLIDVIAFFLCDLTHAMNFYVYSLSAKRFRRQFVELVLCQKRQVATSTTQYVSLSRTSFKSDNLSSKDIQ